MPIEWDKYAVKPAAASSAQPSKIDWDKYAARPEKGTSAQALPEIIKMMLGYAPSMTKPMGQAMRERAVGMGRGFTELGQGAEQLFGAGDSAARERERRIYETMPESKDPMANLFREEAANLPMSIAEIAPFMRQMSMLKRIMTGVGAGAAGGALQYGEEGASKAWQATKGAAKAGALPALEAVMSALFGAGKYAKKGIENVMGSKIGPAEEEAEAARAAHEEAKTQQARAETQALYEVGQDDPKAMIKSKIAKEKELAGLEVPPQETTPILSTQESGQQLEQAQNAHEINQRTVSESEKSISNFLNNGAAHDVRAAEQIRGHQENYRRSVSREYDDIIEQLGRENVEIDNSQAIQDANQRLIDLIRQNETTSPEANRILNELQRLEETHGTSVPADEYLTLVKATKDYARQARQRRYQPDMPADVRERWEQRHAQLEDEAERLENTLAQSVPEELSNRLQQANSNWARYVKPLQRNHTYQTMLHRGRVEGDIMKKLRGRDPGDAIMRNIIQSDPEILKNVIGQRYAANPANLANAGELENEYIQQLPELGNMMENRQRAVNRVQRSQQDLQRAQERHESALEQEKSAQKHVEKQDVKRQEAEKNRAILQEHIQKLEIQIDKLQQALDKTSTTGLERKMKEQALKKLEKDHKKAINVLKGIAGTAIVGGSAWKGISSLGGSE